MFGQKTAFDYLIGLLALGLVLLQVYLVFQYWQLLPERIPTHYNFAGVPDAHGAKTTLLFLPLIGAGLFVMLTVVGLNPQSMNLPVKVTEENRASVYAQAVRFIHFLRLLIGVLFGYLIWGTIQVGLGKQTELDSRILFGLLGVLGLGMVWFFARIPKRNKE
jgi:uncharacterized membrane protein